MAEEKNQGGRHLTEPVKWLGNGIEVLDQSLLPHEEIFIKLGTYQEVAKAIEEMKVRGAPIIGICAAYGLALAAQAIEEEGEAFLTQLHTIAEKLISTRPTAVNLSRAVDRMLKAIEGAEVSKMKPALLAEAKRIHAEEAEATKRISFGGADLIPDRSTILTHCNAGSLATGGYGTALGIIKAATVQGKKVKVIATETRPLLQGARLTSWELMREGIPVALITDSMAGYFMRAGKIDCVVVGADRIAANGDTANKIGTYTLAVLAKENGIPFYVAAPTTTLDLSLPSGDGIPIEFRRPEEVTHIREAAIAPRNVEAVNPAFDVTPHHLISAIVTDRGTLREPYQAGIEKIFQDLWEGDANG